MRVDVHTHMWSDETVPDFIRTYAASRGAGSSVESGADSLLRSMDACGIDASVAVALIPEPDPEDDLVSEINDYVRVQVAGHSDRLAGFCAVNPRSPKAVDDLRRHLDTWAQGLKFHGAMQEMSVDSQSLYPIYEVMAAYGRPVLFHSGDIGVLPTKNRYTRAELFDAIACDFPSMPMILGHACRIEWSAVAGLLRKHRNVYAEISSVIGRDQATQARPLGNLLVAIKEWAGSLENVLFGSDAPLYSQADTQQNIDRLLDEPSLWESVLSADEILAVRDTNSGRFATAHNLFTTSH